MTFPVRIPVLTALIAVLRRATVAGAVVSVCAAVVGPVAAADPSAPPPPVQPGAPRPMPADPPRINPIGGAQVSSTTPQGETAGLEAPLAAQVERGEATVPMWAKDGIFTPTLHPNRQIVIHLPDELDLGPAAWTGDGGAVYGSPDVDYAVTPVTGGGADITVTRKTVFSSSTIPFGIKLPPATHLRQGNNIVLVETDPAPGRPAAIIGTFSIPAAHDHDQIPLTVTPTLGPGFPPGQSNLTIDLGSANIFAFPVTITLSYRASDMPTTGAPTPNWQGQPPGAENPAPQTPVNPAQCPGGVNDYHSPDGRTADFTPACTALPECVAATPEHTSLTACQNRLLAHMSVACTTTFGQTGDDYQACIRTASDQVAWVKTNMPGGPG